MKTEKKDLKTQIYKNLIYIVFLIFAFLIQTSVFPLIPFMAVSPDLLLIFTFTVAFLEGSINGMCYGLLAGLIMDMFYSGPFGFYTLIYVVIAYINGHFSRLYYEEFLFIPVFICFLSEIIYQLYIYVFRFLIRGKLDILYCFIHIAFPELVFSMIFTLLIYLIIFKANERLRERL